MRKKQWKPKCQSTQEEGKVSPGFKLGSISNHDNDGDKNFTNLNIQPLKTDVLHALHVRFSFCKFRSHFRPINYLVCN